MNGSIGNVSKKVENIEKHKWEISELKKYNI